MEKEVFKALTGGLGLAGKLVSRSVDEVSKVVKRGDEGVELLDTGLYHVPLAAGAVLAPRVRWLETQASSRLGVNLLKGLTMSAGEKEFLTGLAHMLQGRYPQALDSLRESTRRSDSKIQVTDAYFVLGSLLLQEGQVDEASRHFHTALMAQQGLGRGLKRWCPTFHISLALTEYSSFCLGPDLIGLTLALGLSQFHRDPAEAVHTLEQLLELIPGEPSALFFVNLLRFRCREDRSVFQSLQKVLPDSNLHVACMVLLGLSCARLGDPVTARELYRKSLQRQELDATLVNDLKVCLAQAARLSGSEREADAELQAVAQKYPHYVSFEARWGIQLAPNPEEISPTPAEEIPPPTPPVSSPPPEPQSPVSLIDASGSASHLYCSEKDLRVEFSNLPLTIGREADVSLLEDSAASRQHARLSLQEGDIWIEDLGSTNGTWVNRHRIRKAVELHRGDVVEIGGHRFEVR